MRSLRYFGGSRQGLAVGSKGGLAKGLAGSRQESTEEVGEEVGGLAIVEPEARRGSRQDLNLRRDEGLAMLFEPKKEPLARPCFDIHIIESDLREENGENGPISVHLGRSWKEGLAKPSVAHRLGLTIEEQLRESLTIKTESADPYISAWVGEALEYFSRWEQADSEEEKSGLGWACNKCVHAIGYYEKGLLTENALYDSGIEVFEIEHPKRGPGKVLAEPIDREWLGQEEEFDWPQNVLLNRGDSPLVARGVMQMGPSIAVRYGAGDYSLV